MQLLSNDIIIEILSWLPARSLLRFRWVCKYWLDLITNNDFFIKMHAHRSTTTKSSVLSFCFIHSSGNNTNANIRYFSNKNTDEKKLFQGYYLNYNNGTNYDVPSDVNRISYQLIYEILGSSNGLVLLMTKLHLCILNPCTKEYRVLPSPLVIEEEEELVSRHNSVLMLGTYGFGYDQTIDDYKVVRIKYCKRAHDDLLCFDVQVYTLGKNSWRRIIGANIPCRLRDRWSSPGVFLNGALYWMDYLHRNIISFDIGMENFQHVSKTPNLRSANKFTQLQVFEGSLCLERKINRSQNSPVEVWVMNDYAVNNNDESSLWSKLLTIPHLEYFPIKLIRYTMNGEILMLNHHKDLVSYDPKNTSYQTISRIREDRNHFLVLEVYTETLLSLNSGTYTDQQQKEEHNTNKRKKINSGTCTDQQQREEHNTNMRKKMR